MRIDRVRLPGNHKAAALDEILTSRARVLPELLGPAQGRDSET